MMSSMTVDRETAAPSARRALGGPVGLSGPFSAFDQSLTWVSLVGRIAAGQPILTEESIQGTFPLPKHLIGGGTLFLLQVSGDSMIDAAIADGDWVIIRQQPVAENGEIVAAMIDGEATIKTFKRSDGHIWLVPQNPLHKPILGDEAIVLGKAVALLRRL
jgi:repressor LexA